MRLPTDTQTEIYFTDFFKVQPDVLEEYGAFNVSLIDDLPLFVDPFLLFNSENKDYQRLHEQMIDYVRFLRDKAVAGQINKGLLTSWFMFPEVKQTWLGFSESGNTGSGLGLDFARALHRNLNELFTESDFCTNLIKEFLLDYTQTFAQHINSTFRRDVAVPRVRFNYATQVWESKNFDLPWEGDGYVLLTPKSVLTKDENWINRNGLIQQYSDIVGSVSDGQLRAQINNYFATILPQEHSRKEMLEAREGVIRRSPELIDHYIRYKEEHGEEAEAYSDKKVAESEQLYIAQVRDFAERLRAFTRFYASTGDTRDEARQRVVYLKDVIENKGAHRLFYTDDKPIRREKDLQLMFRLTWFASPSDVSSEVNDGRGPVDFKISRGSLDKSLVAFKLSSNTNLARNLEKQVEIYRVASDARHALKVVLYFTREQQDKVSSMLRRLDLDESEDVILIDGRADNKPSGSKA